MPNIASIMGVNYSSYFQSVPISPVSAAAQIAGLPVTSVKTFTHDYDFPFIRQRRPRQNLTLAVGCTTTNWPVWPTAHPITGQCHRAIRRYRGLGLRRK